MFEQDLRVTLGNRRRNLPNRKPRAEILATRHIHKCFLNNEFTVLILQSRERSHLCRLLDPLPSLSNLLATAEKSNYLEEMHSARMQLNLAKKGLDSSLTNWKVETRLSRL